MIITIYYVESSSSNWPHTKYGDCFFFAATCFVLRRLGILVADGFLYFITIIIIIMYRVLNVAKKYYKSCAVFSRCEQFVLSFIIIIATKRT